jgi:hypothetical protein
MSNFSKELRIVYIISILLQDHCSRLDGCNWKQIYCDNIWFISLDCLLRCFELHIQFWRRYMKWYYVFKSILSCYKWNLMLVFTSVLKFVLFKIANLLMHEICHSYSKKPWKNILNYVFKCSLGYCVSQLLSYIGTFYVHTLMG